MAAPFLSNVYHNEDKPIHERDLVELLREYYLNQLEKDTHGPDRNETQPQGMMQHHPKPAPDTAKGKKANNQDHNYKFQPPHDYTRSYTESHKIWQPEIKSTTLVNAFIASAGGAGAGASGAGVCPGAAGGASSANCSTRSRASSNSNSNSSLNSPVSPPAASPLLTPSPTLLSPYLSPLSPTNMVSSINLGGSTHSSKHKSLTGDNTGFLKYLHIPNIIGEAPIPPLVYHDACTLGSKIYYFGGVKTIFNKNHSLKSLHELFKVTKKVSLPLPINNELINNPSVIPNNDMFVLSSETNVLSIARIKGDIPPCLCSMSSSPISKRYIFYYGGFEIVDKVSYDPNSDTFEIQKCVRVNNSGYVFDTVSLVFKKFELIAHPNYITRFPVTIPRFGHSSNSVNMGKSSVSTIFIMGGYKQDESQQYAAIQDLWKVELTVDQKGKNDYIKFGEHVLATPIPIGAHDPQPSARSFHTCQVVNNNALLTLEEKQKQKLQPQPSEDQIHYKLICHGGTDGEQILGDSWLFDFNSEKWTHLETYFHKFDEYLMSKKDKYIAQMKRVAHQSIIQDNFLIVIGGAMVSDFYDIDEINSQDDVPDVSFHVQSVKSHLKEADNTKSDQIQRFFVLDIKNKTWLLVKYFHDIIKLGSSNNMNSLSYFGNVGGTVNESNSRIFICGGQILPHQQFKTNKKNPSSTFQLNILNNSISIVDDPLGSTIFS